MKKYSILALLTFMFISATFAQGLLTGPDDYFYIQSVKSKNTLKGFWDLPGYNPSYTKGAALKVYTLEPYARDRVYRFEEAGDGYYYIIPQNASRKGRIDVSGNKKGNGVKIQTWDNNTSGAQKFKIVHKGQGKFKIYTTHGDILCLAGRSDKDGTSVHAWEDHEGDFTEWYFIRKEDLSISRFNPDYLHKEPKFFKSPDDLKLFVKTQNAYTAGSKGEAKVIDITDNKVTLELTMTGRNPMNGKIETSTYEKEIYVENGKYYTGSGEGKMEGIPSNGKLILRGAQSVITFIPLR